MTDLSPCTAGARCRKYLPGHRMHQIHAGHVKRSPWGWRGAVVRSIDAGNVAVLDYVGEEGSCTLWHHHDLAVMCPPGTPVSVHEQWRALLVAGAVLNVHLLDGVGPVPEPGEGLADGGPAIVVDLATGQGVTER